MGAFVASVSVASAISYVDDNTAVTFLNVLNPSYTGSWDIASQGYNPLAQQITSAVASFSFNDALGGKETYFITINGTTVNTGTDIVSPFFGSVTFDDSITGSVLVTLDTTGQLSYTVSRTSGSFQLVDAVLTVEATTRSSSTGGNSVPDGGMTAMMLGSGLLGLAGLRKKLATR